MSTDRDDIVQLIYTYADRIDSGDFEGVADLFAHAEITVEGTDQLYRGREEALGMYVGTTRRYPNGTPNTKHVMTNVMVDVDEAKGTGTSKSYFTVLQEVPGSLTLQPIISGRYRDRFEKVDGSWRFAGMHIIMDLMGDLGHHLLIDVPEASPK
jgi:hypothetical protein